MVMLYLYSAIFAQRALPRVELWLCDVADMRYPKMFTIHDS